MTLAFGDVRQGGYTAKIYKSKQVINVSSGGISYGTKLNSLLMGYKNSLMRVVVIWLNSGHMSDLNISGEMS